MCNLNENVKEKQELIDLMRENGPEWTEALMELLRSADGATPEQIAEAVAFLNEQKSVRVESVLRVQIADGEGVMEERPDRELTAYDFMVLKKLSNDDPFEFANNAFLVGVSVGFSICSDEAMMRPDQDPEDEEEEV